MRTIAMTAAAREMERRILSVVSQDLSFLRFLKRSGMVDPFWALGIVR